MQDELGLGAATAAWQLGKPGPLYASYRLLLVAKMVDRCITRQLYDIVGISLAEWRVLRQLYDSAEPASLRELAETAWVDRAEVSRAVTTLVRRRFVQRRTNPEDRRSSLLTCTKQGRAAIDKILPQREYLHKRLTSRLSRAELEQFVETLLVIGQESIAILEDSHPPPRRKRKR